MLRVVSIITMIFSLNLIANDSLNDSYSIEIPEELARDIEDHSYRNFGDLKYYTLTINTENDNLGHGIGAGLGLKAKSPFEGDDLGKSFSLNLDLLMEYENAEVLVSFFSDMYSRFGMRFNDHGVMTEINGDGKTVTENLGYEGVRVKLTKDVSQRSFLTFELEVARENDQNTMAMFIQDFFHDVTKKWDNAQGGKQVQYHYDDYRKSRAVITSTIGMGRNFTLYRSKRFTVENRSEIGHRFSTESNFDATFIKTDFKLEAGRTQLRLYGEIDTKENYVFGAAVEREILKNDKYELSMSLGVSKEDNYYNDGFPDLGDHYVGARELKNNDLLYQYTLKLKFK